MSRTAQQSPLLRPDTDSVVALAASLLSVTAPASPASSAGIVSSLTRPPRHIESPPSIVLSGTRAPPCHAPRACQHILGPAVVCPRWTSPQLKQAAAASRSLSRPELTRKAEALNQAVDPYLPAPIRSEGLPRVKPHLLLSQVLPSAIRGSDSENCQSSRLSTTAHRTLHLQDLILSLLPSFPHRQPIHPKLGTNFPWTACLQISWPPALSLFSSGAPSVPPETNSLCWSMP